MYDDVNVYSCKYGHDCPFVTSKEVDIPPCRGCIIGKSVNEVRNDG